MLSCAPAVSEFAEHVADGLLRAEGKYLSARYFYDDLGSKLFEAITVLPEYGLTRADERILLRAAEPLMRVAGPLSQIVELGSGSGKKTAPLLRAAYTRNPEVTYAAIDISDGALQDCRRELQPVLAIRTICDSWMPGLQQAVKDRDSELPVLVLFLGSTVGNLERDTLPSFFREIRRLLRAGDYLLLGADLVKDVNVMLAAYDDPVGVTAAFNKNILARINLELDAHFDLRSFRHEARWNARERRIEMHLVSERRQNVKIGTLESAASFGAGESIWTESSHKFELSELEALARAADFVPVEAWTDRDWPMAEALWRVA